MATLHRNSQKRIYAEGAEYFITTVTHDRHPYFANAILAELFIRDLWFARELKQFDLFGYAIMPEHVHMLIQPRGKANYSEIMRSVKTNFSRNANDIILNRVNRFQFHPEGDVTSHRLRTDPNINPNEMAPHRLRNQISAHRLREFQQHYLNVVESLRERFNAKYGLSHGVPPFQWQKSFLDHIIRDEEDYLNHLEYIFNNAVKHGLVAEPEQFPYMWIVGMPPLFTPD